MILTKESIDRSASGRVRQSGASCSCRPQSRSSHLGDVLISPTTYPSRYRLTFERCIIVGVFFCTTLATTRPTKKPQAFPTWSHRLLYCTGKKNLMDVFHPLAAEYRNNIFLTRPLTSIGVIILFRYAPLIFEWLSFIPIYPIDIHMRIFLFQYTGGK